MAMRVTDSSESVKSMTKTQQYVLALTLAKDENVVLGVLRADTPEEIETIVESQTIVGENGEKEWINKSQFSMFHHPSKEGTSQVVFMDFKEEFESEVQKMLENAIEQWNDRILSIPTDVVVDITDEFMESIQNTSN